MAIKWHRLCKGKDLEAHEDHVVITFPNDRTHLVMVEETDEHYRLTAHVLRSKSKLEAIENIADQILYRNKITPLVGFRFNRRGGLIGEAVVPKAGLDTEEFGIYLRAVASESDRFEYLLTGKDVE